MSVNIVVRNQESTVRSWNFPAILVSFGILAILQYMSYSPLHSIRPFARISFNLIAPLLVCFVYIMAAILILNITDEQDMIKETMLFSVVVAVFGIFFAITLNGRSFLFILSVVASGLIDIKTAQLLVFAIIAPIIEEFAKIYPALLLSRQFVVKEKRQRFIKSPQILLVVAVVGGSIFNMLETYWYSWQSGSLSNVGNNSEWFLINFQIVLRAINPLHLTSTLISAMGIILALQISTEPVLTKKDVSIVLPYFFGAIFLHGLWNGNSIIIRNQPVYFDLIPLFNLILIPVTLLGYFAILYRFRNYDLSSCEECGQWHVPGIGHDIPIELEPTFRQRLFSDAIIQYQCKACRAPKSGKECPNCDATEVFACDNCKYPLPIFAYKCWRCDNEVETIYDDLTLVPNRSSDKFIQGVFLLFSILYIGEFLILLVSVVRGSDALSSLATSSTLFAIISITLFVGIYLNFSSNLEGWGMILSRYMASLILLLLSLFLLAVAFLFIAVRFIASSFLLLFFAGIYVTFAFRTIIPEISYVEVK